MNINDIFYSQYSHQPVSAGIAAIFRLNTNCVLVIRTSPWRWLEYWSKHVGYSIMNKIYRQCERGTYYNEYKPLRIFVIIPKMCQSHRIYFVLNSGVNLLPGPCGPQSLGPVNAMLWEVLRWQSHSLSYCHAIVTAVDY